MKVKDLSPQMRLQPAEVELAADPMVTPIGQSSGGLSFFADSFKRGYGNNVFGSDSNGIWLGAADFADAPFKVDMEGNLTATKATITGMGQNFVSTLAWTATDRDTATWSSGTIKTTSGVSYSISGGNTGNIVATTYIYLDINTSVTVLQQSTTATDAVGSGKIPIATVQIGPVGGECIINVVNSPGTTIDGAKIITGSITASEIAAGTITADKLAVSYIQVSGAAADINAGATTISGGKITANTITADRLNVSTLSSISANIGTITAGSITADVVNAGTLNADRIPGLNTSKITAGAFSIGAASQPTYIQIKRDDGSGSNAYLRFEGGSKMWADSSNRIGINSLGSPMYIYINSGEQIVIPENGQTTIRDGVYCDGNLNVSGSMRCNAITLDQSADEANIGDINILKGYNDLNLQLGSNSYYFSFYDSGFNEKAHIDSSGNIQKDGSVSFDIIHPEIKNYRLRYPAIEAPEVALKIRGVGKLENGVATISTPHHWSLVNEKDGLITVLLTPMGDCKGLYTPKEKLTFTGFEVRELQNGQSNVEFTWELTCVRKNYLNFNPEYPMTDVQIERMQHMKVLKEERIAELQNEAISLGMDRKDIQGERDIEILRKLVIDMKKQKSEVL